MIKSEKKIPVDFRCLNETKFCVAVINYSGNTGKSIVGNYLLRMHMDFQGYYVISNINTYNKKHDDEIVLSGESFNEVLKDLSNLDSAIVDIAAHNTHYAINIMQNNIDFYKLFD